MIKRSKLRNKMKKAFFHQDFDKLFCCLKVSFSLLPSSSWTNLGSSEWLQKLRKVMIAVIIDAICFYANISVLFINFLRRKECLYWKYWNEFVKIIWKLYQKTHGVDNNQLTSFMRFWWLILWIELMIHRLDGNIQPRLIYIHWLDFITV